MKNLLGDLHSIKPTKLSIIRLKTIKMMFEALLVESMSKATLAGVMELSHSGVRKNIKVLHDAGVVPSTNMCSITREVIYSVVDDDELVLEFSTQLDELIASAEEHVRDKKPWQSRKGTVVKDSEMNKVSQSRLFTIYEYEPGRRIYSSDSMTTDTMRIARNRQIKIDPLRCAGLL